MFILYYKTLLLLLRWASDKVRDRFGGMGRFKGALRCKGWVNSVIINVITEMNYRCITYYISSHIFFFKSVLNWKQNS